MIFVLDNPKRWAQISIARRTRVKERGDEEMRHGNSSSNAPYGIDMLRILCIQEKVPALVIAGAEDIFIIGIRMVVKKTGAML